MRATIGESFSKGNSLNFLRVVLALTVVAGHAIDWGSYGTDEALLSKTTIGTIAVFGFFGISGYLIAGSASHNSLGRYLWQRALRILPAFWVCLVVMVLFFGAIGFTHTVHPPHCGFSCYLQHRGVPYLLHDGYLRITHNLGRGNLVHNGQYFDGQLWTLFYEFLCYLALGALAFLGLLRRRVLVAAFTLGVWITEIVVAFRPPRQGINFDAVTMLMLGPVFLTGTLIYLYRDRLRDSAVLAIACGVLFVAATWLPIGGRTAFDRPTSIDLVAPLVAYPLLWLGIHLPFQRVGARNDYSYGIYIYGSPVLALLTLWGVSKWGYVPYLLIAVAWTFAFALASWWLVEKHALKLKKVVLGSATRRHGGGAPTHGARAAADSRVALTDATTATATVSPGPPITGVQV